MRPLTEERSAQDKECANQLNTLFKAVYAFDSNSLKLRDKLKKKSPGVSTEAGMKFHCLLVGELGSSILLSDVFFVC